MEETCSSARRSPSVGIVGVIGGESGIVGEVINTRRGGLGVCGGECSIRQRHSGQWWEKWNDWSRQVSWMSCSQHTVEATPGLSEQMSSWQMQQRAASATYKIAAMASPATSSGRSVMVHRAVIASCSNSSESGTSTASNAVLFTEGRSGRRTSREMIETDILECSESER